MKNRGKPFLFMLLLVFLLAACGDPAAEVTPTPEPMPTESRQVPRQRYPQFFLM